MTADSRPVGGIRRPWSPRTGLERSLVGAFERADEHFDPTPLHLRPEVSGMAMSMVMP